MQTFRFMGSDRNTFPLTTTKTKSFKNDILGINKVI